ncbi:MAG: alkaline phosphatase family protein, partial [Aurantibacter sp.]
MKVIISNIMSFALIGLLVLGSACTNGAKNNSKVAEAEHVIVIGVDAMSPDGIINAVTPTLDEMMKNGAYTLNARGVLPTSS